MEVFNISKRALINEEIRAHEVRVIDNEGKQLGILKIDQALRTAENVGLDLVEIAAESKPPVCKIMDYGKYRFEKEKKEKENRKKQQIAELKELQLTCNIGEHDFQTKVGHSNRFLSQGNKVKVLVKFKGREMAHTERGAALLERFMDACSEFGQSEKPAVLEGRNMILIINPQKTNTNLKGNKKDGKNQDSQGQCETL
ncbi:MAG: translation initiation factor IF-3 [Eubacteriales bacterium]|nr:translation initiation factor IF-3 [Eubacteriales bacterium]